MLRTTTIVIATALVLCGCVQEIDAPMARETTDAAWVTRVDFEDGTFCTAIAMSEHWLLTAGHCIRGVVPNNEIEAEGKLVVRAIHLDERKEIYKGPAHFILHPEYNESNRRSNRWYDIGLIALSGEIEMDSYALFSDAEFAVEQLSSETPAFAVGIGYETDPQTGRCTKRAGSAKRYDGFLYRASSGPGLRDAEAVKLDGREHALCHGDSGSPIMIEIDGSNHVFSVFSGATRDRQIFHASLVGPKRGWIVASSERADLPLECVDMGPASWQCFE